MSKNTGFTVWLTGMLGTGKTTMANYLAARLRQVGHNVEVLDEKEFGQVMWDGSGETKEARNLVVRRLGYLANLLTRNDVAVLVAATSPYKAARDENRRAIGRYIEVYVDCPTEKLIQRDSTGRYKKALSGEIPNFIGITAPYEPPTTPEATLHSDVESVEDGARNIFQALLDLSYVRAEDLKVITGKRFKANPPPKSARRPSKAIVRGARKARPAARAGRLAKPKKAAGKAKGR